MPTVITYAYLSNGRRKLLNCAARSRNRVPCWRDHRAIHAHLDSVG